MLISPAVNLLPPTVAAAIFAGGLLLGLAIGLFGYATAENRAFRRFLDAKNRSL